LKEIQSKHKFFTLLQRKVSHHCLKTLGLDLLEEREKSWMSLRPDGEQAKDDGPESGREETAPIISDLEQNGSYLRKERTSYYVQNHT
jgi:hypothetical protein